MNVSSKDFASIDFGTPPATGVSSGKKKLVLMSVLAVLLLACIGASAAYLFDFWPFAKHVAPTSVMEEPVQPEIQQAPAAPAPQTPARLQYLDSLVFGQYEHNIVENEKIGKMLVITGKVVNNSPVSVGQIKIEAKLLGADDSVTDSQVITAGPTVSIFDLRVLPQADLEARLKSIQDILLNNGTVRPGDEVPFTIVFYHIPEGTKNFALKVADYLELAQPATPGKPGTPAQPGAPAQPVTPAQPGAPGQPAAK